MEPKRGDPNTWNKKSGYRTRVGQKEKRSGSVTLGKELTILSRRSKIDP